jgi:aminoglycoside phosphotransferase (APT) family kinase protein
MSDSDAAVSLTHDELARRLRISAERRYGEPVGLEGLKALSGGASASTWQFDLIRRGERLPMILQLAAGERFSSALTKTQQGATQQRAAELGVPTPRVHWILDPQDGLGEGYISERLVGETLGKRIVGDPALAQARTVMAAQCGTILARIHSLDPNRFADLPTVEPATALAQLAAQHRAYGERLPVFELAFRWLAEHLPRPRPPRLVHGDFRNGNLMVDSTGIVAVLDWELAHLGDPMTDLGWLCMNAWRFGVVDLHVGGFGSREDLYRAYERENGVPVDEAAVRFWEVFGTLKWGVICQYFAFQYIDGEVRSVERASIGRRVCETELDLLNLMRTRACR